jgi:predicted dehydrogenase
VAQRQTLIILNPGHFHAALTLRASHPLIDDDIHVFAEDGPDVDNFVRLVHSFNDRAVNPTHWTLYVYRGADYLEKLLAQRPGNVVIIAGRNNEKMPLIHLLHAQGFCVLGDKPWLVESGQVGLLEEITASAPLAMDIMTERHEIVNRLQKAFVRQPAIFGGFRIDGGQPAIAIRSVHHLYKMVNGAPLRRPAWYFDLAAQGEGITDVTTHLVDLVQWMTGNESRFVFDRDVARLSARQWPTAIPRDIFSRITGLEDFPPFLQDRGADDTLQYLCNAALSYELRSIPTAIETLWGLEEPAGAGDLHHAVLRGSKADLIADQGAQTGFLTTLTVNPVEGGKGYADALTGAVEEMQEEFPGIGLEAEGKGFRITIPKMLRTTHEQHFAAVLQTFLTYLDEGTSPGNIGPDLNCKYTLLARALELSHGKDPHGAPG